jgi:hypothetical protein
MSEAQLPPDLESRLEGVLALEGQGYFGLPLPCSEDAHVGALVEGFAAAREAVREKLRRRLTRVHVGLLTAFAVRMASLAVREQSGQRLRLGLLAFALAGDSPDADWRDVFADFPPLEDAALRIRVDVRDAYAEATRLADGRTTRKVLAWASPPRSPWLRLLKRAKLRLVGGSWRATDSPDGFRYASVNPVSEAELIERAGEREQPRIR